MPYPDSLVSMIYLIGYGLIFEFDVFYCRVMVMDHGVIKEFDTPTALLADQKSMFYGMAKDAGLV